MHPDPEHGARAPRRQAPPTWLVPAALALIVAVGLGLRVGASRFQGPITDEVLSFLGASMVAEKGVPVLPSDVLYLHGTIHSYLLAPLIAAGIGGIDDYFGLRLVSAAAGAVTIGLSFRLARVAGASGGAALLAALLVAIDPTSILWSGYLRMYALAQTLAVAVAILFLQSIADRAQTPTMTRNWTPWALVVVFWLAVFTHLATALLWPAMAAVAVVVFGRDLLRGRRDLTAALAACLLAPLTLTVVSGAFGPGAGTALSERPEGLPGISFLGEDNVNLGQIVRPDPSPWTSLFEAGPLDAIVPLLLVLASGVLVGHWLAASDAARPAAAQRAIGALLALHWLPILALAMFATDAAQRYVLFLLPSGYVLVGLAVDVLAAPSSGRWRVGWAMAGGAVLAAALVMHSVAAAVWQSADPFGQGNERAEFLTTAEYVAARLRPDELVLTTGPVGMSLALADAKPQLRFLPGGQGSQRARRYTRFTATGEPIDYWMGTPSLPTTKGLCNALRKSPGSWIIVSDRIWEHWGYNDLPPRRTEKMAGAMRDLVSGVADLEHQTPASQIFRSRPYNSRSEEARLACPRRRDKEDRGNRGERRASSPRAGRPARAEDAATPEPTREERRNWPQDANVPTERIREERRPRGEEGAREGAPRRDRGRGRDATPAVVSPPP